MRLPALLNFLEEEKPSIVLLQETKCMTEKFPRLEIEERGYNILVHGQKTFNGVAILSKGPFEDSTTSIPGFEDEQARYIECLTTIDNKVIRVASVYVPNGQAVGSDKFEYKLRFLNALKTHLANLLKHEEIMAIGGDFNVAPDDIDVFDPKALDGEIGFNIEERKLIREIMNLGLHDSFRIKHPKQREFSWWDYRGSSLRTDSGMRIDQIYLSPEGTDLLQDAKIYKSERVKEKASDHAPIECTLST